MNKERIFGLARHVLTFLGGYAVAEGYIDESMVDEVVGAVITIAGLAWSVAAPEKKKAA